MHFSSVFAIATLIASASALTAGHNARGHNHRAIAARVAQPAGVTDKVTPTVRKRANKKRCKSRKSSSAALVGKTTTTTTKVKATATPKEEDVEPANQTPKAEVSISKTIKQTNATPKADPTPAPTKDAATNEGSNTGLSFMIGVQTGEGTFYDTGLGACGIRNKDTDYIAAMSQHLFDAYPGYKGDNPNKNPLCNKKVKATYKGKSVTVAITDRCVGCQTTDLDFSPTAFSQLADFGVGRLVGMTWEWV